MPDARAKTRDLKKMEPKPKPSNVVLELEPESCNYRAKNQSEPARKTTTTKVATAEPKIH